MLALSGKDLYSLNGQDTAVFTRLSDSALLSSPAWHDAAPGFQTGIYRDDKQYVLAFAVTNTGETG